MYTHDSVVMENFNLSVGAFLYASMQFRFNLGIARCGPLTTYATVYPFLRHLQLLRLLHSLLLQAHSYTLIHTHTENIALGKPAAQSSLFGIGPLEGAPGKAVDGIADPNYENGHCSHTHSDNPSWWRVDLGSKGAPVSEVYIVNRFTTDPNLQQRSKDYKITLGKTQLSASVNYFTCIRSVYMWSLLRWLRNWKHVRRDSMELERH